MLFSYFPIICNFKKTILKKISQTHCFDFREQKYCLKIKKLGLSFIAKEVLSIFFMLKKLNDTCPENMVFEKKKKMDSLR